jgi:hypothetical protein
MAHQSSFNQSSRQPKVEDGPLARGASASVLLTISHPLSSGFGFCADAVLANAIFAAATAASVTMQHPRERLLTW